MTFFSVRQKTAARAGCVALFLLLSPAVAADSVLRLATTTSAENSGLLAYLLPDFEKQCACKLEVIAVGSGRALALGRRGDADVLMVHSPADEAEFVRQGYGVRRRLIMFNDFVLLGPKNDPAAAAAQKDILGALSAIARGRHKFVSRGDDSGTHKKEQQLWRETDFSPESYPSEWFISAGTGMGQAIVIADELSAYLLSDRGTYLYFRGKTQMKIVSENSPPLHNPYSIMTINPRRFPHVNLRLAKKFTAWLLQPTVQKRIADYRALGEQLFYPAFAPSAP